MGEDARQTLEEIEHTRDELAQRVDELVDRARVEAAQVGRKVGLGALALAGLLVVGYIAKRRVR